MSHSNSSMPLCATGDLLSRWVVLSQVSACLHTHCQLQQGYDLKPDFGQPYRGIFHLLRRGCCRVNVGNREYILNTGDLLFFPHGLTHVINALEGRENTHYSPQESNQSSTFNISQIGDRADAELLCGYFDYAPNSLLIEQLPEVIHLPVHNDIIAPLYPLLYREIDQQLPAQKMAIDSLSGYLFIVILRGFLSDSPQVNGLLGLKDKALLSLIKAFSDSPEKSWTLAEMASYCHLSRAVFAKRFHEQVGLTPNRFLTQMRLSIAALLLKTTNQSILDIALSVGFQSESYFGKCFKAQTNLTPNVYRDQSKY